MTTVEQVTCRGASADGKPCKAHGWKVLETGYCHWHDPDRQLDEASRKVVRDTRTKPSCDVCGGRLPTNAKANQRYCGKTCSNRGKKLRQKARDALRDANKREVRTAQQIAVSGVRARRGAGYDAFCETEWPERIHDPEDPTTLKMAGKALATTEATISRWMIAWREDRQDQLARDAWEMDPYHAELLGEDRISMPNPREAPEAYDLWLEIQVVAFCRFSDEFFLTEDEELWAIESFHRRWIKAILHAYFTCQRQLILSPPRHGKTELLQRICIWLIIRRPNIRIVWIGPNGDIARESVGAIMDELENNKKLVRAYCAPGTGFKPSSVGRGSKEWAPSGGRFTVATRTVTGMTAPTMVAFGRGGKVLSRTADWIVADDLEDHDSTKLDSSRADTQKWMVTTFGTRKMKKTGVCLIGSRQHHDDWYSRAIDNPIWNVIIDSAHSWECQEDPDDWYAHTDCMLFPSLNPYDWLMEQFLDAENADGGRALAEMSYLNKTVEGGLVQFIKAEIEACFNRSRVMGDTKTLPGHVYHIAGFDPTGSAGFQSAFYWCYMWDEQGSLLLWVVDISNDQIGGFAGARKQIREWSEKYPELKVWVIEKTLYDGEMMKDDELKKLAASHGLEFIPHDTQSNKRDRRYGPTALAPMFTNGQIDIPYGDSYSQKQADTWQQQCVRFNNVLQLGSQATKRLRVDTVMSSWFPLAVIRQRRYDTIEVEVEYESTFGGSYVGVDWGVPADWS